MVTTPTSWIKSEEEGRYRGLAMSQMRILQQQLALGKLNMGTRVVKLDNGVVITCVKCFAKEDVHIHIPTGVTEKHVEIVEEFSLLVCVPRLASDGVVFPLTTEAFDRQYGLKVKDAENGLEYEAPVSKIDVAGRGNYHLATEDAVYSIIAPVHHLANEPNNKILIPSYTRYAWTTNVTGIDIHTCYSEYVYSQGEPFFRGTYAPPESEFQSALIVGLGIDGEDNIHVAQLIEAGEGSGYWLIKDKEGVALGVLFGAESNAATKADTVEGSFSEIWKNESKTRWWVEFHSTNCLSLNEHGLMPASLNISRRESSSRAGGVKQWFYDNGTWKQHGTSVPAILEFKGLQYEDSLKKTEYEHYPSGEINGLFIGKPVTIAHKALSWSGVQGLHREKLLKAYQAPDWAVTFIQSDNWGQDNSYADAFISGNLNIDGELCVGAITVSSSLEGATLSIIVPLKHYRVTITDRCVPDKSNVIVEGDFVVSSNLGEKKLHLSYTTRPASWVQIASVVADFTVPYGCGGETLYSSVITGRTKKDIYRCGAIYPSYQEDVRITSCRYCQPNYILSSAPYTMDPGSFTRPDTRWTAGSVISFSTEETMATGPFDGSGCADYGWGFNGAPNCPCCEDLTYYRAPKIQRNFWIIFTRWYESEWRCI